ncbi:MAG: nucleotidyltransferase family protein [Gemmatimonadota bacterium]
MPLADRTEEARSWVLDLLAGRAGPAPEELRPTLLPILRLHRLESLAWWEADPGWTALEGAARAVAVRNGVLLEAVAGARSDLAAVGVASLVFKGAALLLDRVYPSPGARPMDDADLLVRPAQASLAAAALQRYGFQPWRPWSDRLPEWADSLPFEGTGAPVPVTLDLHWRTEYGRMRFGSGDSPLWTAAGGDRPVPPPETHLIVVVEHVLKHLRVGAHLLGVADAARLATRVRDWDEVVRVGGARRSAPGVAALLAALSAELGAPIPAEVPPRLQRTAGGRGDGSWVGIGSWVGRQPSPARRWSGLGQRIRMAATPGRAWEELRETAFPDARWLRARYDSGAPVPALWARYAWASLRWLVAGGRSPLDPPGPVA